MKTLYLMRHAHKEKALNNQDDFDLKLSSEGEIQAKNIGIKLREIGVKPDLIVSSPAARAKKTAEIICQEIYYRKTIMYNEVLFQAFVNELLETITYTFDTVDSMLIIGHNPSLTALTIVLDIYKEEIKPGEVLKIEFDTDSWIHVEKENAKLVWIEKTT